MSSGPDTDGESDPLSVLWPAAVRSAAAPRRGDYVAVPDLARARMLLPRDRSAAAAVLREFRAAGGARERARATAVLAALRTPLLRDRVLVGGPHGEESLEHPLADLLGGPVVLGVVLGAPRANRKPCLQVLDAEHRPLAFAKLGVGPLSDRLIDNEGAALESLADRDLGRVRVPAMRHRGTWGGHALLVTEALPLRRAHRDDHEAVRRAMVAVAASTGSNSGPATWADRQRERLALLADGPVREQVTAVLDRLGADVGPLGCWHGDWTAWNAATLDRHAGDAVLVWDWERYADGVPRGWDALHDALRRDIAASAPTREVTRRLLDGAAGLLAPFGVEPGQAAGVATAYLLEIALRYTEDDQAAAGGRSARVEEWLLPELAGSTS